MSKAEQAGVEEGVRRGGRTEAEGRAELSWKCSTLLQWQVIVLIGSMLCPMWWKNNSNESKMKPESRRLCMIKHSPAQEEFWVLEGQIKDIKSTRKLLYQTQKWMCFKTDPYSSILFDQIVWQLRLIVTVQLPHARHHAVCLYGSPQSLLAQVVVHLTYEETETRGENLPKVTQPVSRKAGICTQLIRPLCPHP